MKKLLNYWFESLNFNSFKWEKHDDFISMKQIEKFYILYTLWKKWLMNTNFSFNSYNWKENITYFSSNDIEDFNDSIQFINKNKNRDDEIIKDLIDKEKQRIEEMRKNQFEYKFSHIFNNFLYFYCESRYYFEMIDSWKLIENINWKMEKHEFFWKRTLKLIWSVNEKDIYSQEYENVFSDDYSLFHFQFMKNNKEMFWNMQFQIHWKFELVGNYLIKKWNKLEKEVWKNLLYMYNEFLKNTNQISLTRCDYWFDYNTDIKDFFENSDFLWKEISDHWSKIKKIKEKDWKDWKERVVKIIDNKTTLYFWWRKKTLKTVLIRFYNKFEDSKLKKKLFLYDYVWRTTKRLEFEIKNRELSKFRDMEKYVEPVSVYNFIQSYYRNMVNKEHCHNSHWKKTYKKTYKVEFDFPLNIHKDNTELDKDELKEIREKRLNYRCRWELDWSEKVITKKLYNKMLDEWLGYDEIMKIIWKILEERVKNKWFIKKNDVWNTQIDVEIN